MEKEIIILRDFSAYDAEGKNEVAFVTDSKVKVAAADADRFIELGYAKLA